MTTVRFHTTHAAEPSGHLSTMDARRCTSPTRGQVCCHLQQAGKDGNLPISQLIQQGCLQPIHAKQASMTINLPPPPIRPPAIIDSITSNDLIVCAKTLAATGDIEDTPSLTSLPAHVTTDRSGTPTVPCHNTHHSAAASPARTPSDQPRPAQQRHGEQVMGQWASTVAKQVEAEPKPSETSL